MASLQYRQRSVLTANTTAFTIGSAYCARYYITQYGFDTRITALLAACFSLPCGIRV